MSKQLEWEVQQEYYFRVPYGRNWMRVTLQSEQGINVTAQLIIHNKYNKSAPPAPCDGHYWSLRVFESDIKRMNAGSKQLFLKAGKPVTFWLQLRDGVATKFKSRGSSYGDVLGQLQFVDNATAQLVGTPSPEFCITSGQGSTKYPPHAASLPALTEPLSTHTPPSEDFFRRAQKPRATAAAAAAAAATTTPDQMQPPAAAPATAAFLSRAVQPPAAAPATDVKMRPAQPLVLPPAEIKIPSVDKIKQALDKWSSLHLDFPLSKIAAWRDSLHLQEQLVQLLTSSQQTQLAPLLLHQAIRELDKLSAQFKHEIRSAAHTILLHLPLASMMQIESGPATLLMQSSLQLREYAQQLESIKEEFVEAGHLVPVMALKQQLDLLSALHGFWVSNTKVYEALK